MSILTGNDVQKIFDLAKQKKFAIPAVNVIGSNSINATLETDRYDYNFAYGASSYCNYY